MEIRAHHLLCMKYFKGRGYSEKFVSNFYKTLESLENNPTVKIVNYPDNICNPCPYNKKGECIKKGPDSERRVREKDNIILKQLGVKLNQEINIKEAKKLVESKLTRIKEICKDCECKGWCE